MKRALYMVIGSLLLFSGCSLVTDTDPADLEFSWEPTRAFGTVADSEPEVSAGDGTLTVNGALSAPDPCRRLTGQVDRSARASRDGGSRLVLRIRIISDLSEGEACVTSIGGFQYSAVVRDLEPRTYDLRVIHEYVRSGWSTRTVLEGEVAVPGGD